MSGIRRHQVEEHLEDRIHLNDGAVEIQLTFMLIFVEVLETTSVKRGASTNDTAMISLSVLVAISMSQERWDKHSE